MWSTNKRGENRNGSTKRLQKRRGLLCLSWKNSSAGKRKPFAAWLQISALSRRDRRAWRNVTIPLNRFKHFVHACMCCHRERHTERERETLVRTCTRLQENAALRKEMVAVEEKFNAKALSLKGGIEVLEGKVRLQEKMNSGDGVAVFGNQRVTFGRQRQRRSCWKRPKQNVKRNGKK